MSRPRGATLAELPGQQRWLGLFMLAIVGLLWGLNWPVMKVALLEIPLFTFRSICLFGGSIGMMILARATSGPIRFPRGRVRLLIVASLLNTTIWHIGTGYGIILIDAGRAAIIAFTMPVWAALLSWLFLDERITARTLVGIVLGLTGLVLLMLPGLGAAARSPLGALLVIMAAIAWAAGMLVIKRHDWGMPVAHLAAWQLVFGGIPVYAATVLLDSPSVLAQVSLTAWLATLFATLLAMIIGHWAFYRALHLLPATVTAFGTLATPVIGLISAHLLIDETLSWVDLVAVSLVTASVAVMLNPRSR